MGTRATHLPCWADPGPAPALPDGVPSGCEVGELAAGHGDAWDGWDASGGVAAHAREAWRGAFDIGIPISGPSGPSALVVRARWWWCGDACELMRASSCVRGVGHATSTPFLDGQVRPVPAVSGRPSSPSPLLLTPPSGRRSRPLDPGG